MHVVLFVVNLIYGANYTIAKEVMPNYIQPFGFIMVRVVCASILFIVVQSLLVKERVEKRDFVRLFFCGLFGVAINQLLFFKGLNLTTPINASLVMITAPIIVMLLSTLIKIELISLSKVMGICLGAFGAFLIIFLGKEISLSSETLRGDALVLINAASFAGYLVLVKPLMKKYHPLTVVKWVFLFGMIFVVPAGFEEFKQIDWAHLPIPIWMAILYVVLFTTFFAYLLNVFALSKVNPSLVGSYIYLQPVLASLIALAFAKDELTFIKVVAAVFIFSGVYLVSRKPRKLAG